MGTVSLAITAVLAVAALAGWLVARQRRFPSHCRIMAWAALLNWAPILVVMVPSWLGTLRSPRGLASVGGLVPVGHGVVGAITQLLMTYTAARMNWLKSLPPRRTKWLMRVTMTLWLLATVGGIAVYLYLYVI
jgi:uncharacterized membrane protein YozB (DUF420 family)